MIKRDEKRKKRFILKMLEIKSKIDLLAETVSDNDPALTFFGGNPLTKEEQIPKPGYKIFRDDDTAKIF